MIRYRLSEPARKDLIEIRNFISKENRRAARKILTQLRTACRMLARRPDIGHLRTDLAPEPLRFWPVRSYLIVYRPDARPLEIVRIFHGARDISSLI
jgi:antitoxin ParD1/3/4/toxin ParE1/3/4